ncbi:hypothetical protein BMS3Abin02_02370 [bacterium BMS3Abin02]|nr:hypothetical protein BMS3Abin02_02370 [bacterium BMS3Abin02]GBE21457.1 hypothetical protein BMS3Bbin01_00802 [bacterium BMS3Bbin01]HDH25514.1 hypothetical protein [Actinomycetota bacterium]HDL49481.1 hypothetical protein [Actinomycetota bacterium]
MDPLRHPDLVELTRRLRSQFEEVLGAEQEAAATLHRRTRTLRDRFLDAEDRQESAIVVTVEGSIVAGTITGVGLDHVTLEGSVVPLFHITQAQFR